MTVEEEIGTVFRPLLFRLKADKRTVPNSFPSDPLGIKVKQGIMIWKMKKSKTVRLLL